LIGLKSAVISTPHEELEDFKEKMDAKFKFKTHFQKALFLFEQYFGLLSLNISKG
jgi:hypothetical protein